MKKNKRIIIWAIVLCISAVGTLMEDEANKPKKENDEVSFENDEDSKNDLEMGC